MTPQHKAPRTQDSAESGSKPSGEIELDARTITRRTYSTGRQSVWRVKSVDGSRREYEDVPLELVSQMEKEGLVEVEYTDEHLILAPAGVRRMHLKMAQEQVEALKRQLALAEAALAVLEGTSQHDETPD